MYNFENDLIKAVKAIVGEDKEVIVNDVRKNNDTVLRGLIIKEEDKNCSPTVYIDRYYEQVNDGKDLGEIAAEIVRIIDENKRDDFEDIGEKLRDFEYVRPRLQVKLVNTERNVNYLDGKLSREFLDLSIVPIIEIDTNADGSATATVTKDMAGLYEVTEDEIIDIAIGNTVSAGFECKSMAQVMAEMMGMEADNLGIEDSPMYVISNKTKYRGANALLCAKVFEDLAEKVEDDLYILPSSIHEVLGVPAGVGELRDFRKMVREVNETTVSDEEILSYNVYKFDRETGKIVIA